MKNNFKFLSLILALQAGIEYNGKISDQSQKDQKGYYCWYLKFDILRRIKKMTYGFPFEKKD